MTLFQRMVGGLFLLGVLVFGSFAGYSAYAANTSNGNGNSFAISAECDPDGDGNVVGTVSGIPGPYPRTFDIWATGHTPSSMTFVEIPGSRQTVTATSSSLNYE